MNRMINFRLKNVSLIALFICFALSPLSNASSVINGLSVHSEFGQESFIAGLFTSTPSDNARDIIVSNEDKQIQVRVLANRLSARRFKRMWIEGMAINASSTALSRQSENMAKFSNLLKVTLTRGDIFAVQRTSDSVKIVINGSTLGSIDDPRFFDMLLTTWIGSVPLSSEFRDDLLAAGQLDDALLTRFNAITPSEERIVAVASALKNREEQESEKTTKVVATTKPKITQPVISAPAPVAPPTISAPTVASNNPPKPEPTPKPAPEPVTPAPEPVTPSSDTNAEIAASEPETTDEATEPAPTDEVIETAAAEDSILEEDDEEFTAASLLEQQLYISQLKRLVYKQISYPPTSILKEEEGTVRIKITVNRKGKVTDIVVEQEPEHSRLTKAAVKAVKKSSPFPELPASIREDEFSVPLPIVFRLVSSDGE